MITDTGVLFRCRQPPRLELQRLPRPSPNGARNAHRSRARVAETAYLIAETLGAAVETAFVRSLTTDRYLVVAPSHGDLERMVQLMAAYQTLPLGATDASVIAIAERYHDPSVATLDRRHFTVVVSKLGLLNLLAVEIAPSRR